MKESESEVLKRTRLMRRNGIVHRNEEHLDQLIDKMGRLNYILSFVLYKNNSSVAAAKQVRSEHYK